MDISKETKATARYVLWGAAAGAIALAIVGFNWGGWVTAEPPRPSQTAELLRLSSQLSRPSASRSSDKPLMHRRTWPK